MFNLVEAGEPMTDRPPLHPKIAPKRGQQPPAAYLHGLAATGGWLLFWPLLYVVIESSRAPRSAVIRGITTAGGVLWGLSLIAFWVILSLLQDYSLTLSIFMNGLALLVEILASLVG
jgi:hypothetical protein